MNPENDRIQVTAGPTSLFCFQWIGFSWMDLGMRFQICSVQSSCALMMLTDFSCGKQKELVKWKRCERRYIFKVHVPAIQSWPW